MSLEGTVLADKYRIVRQIGQGGMGAVYEAEHVVIGRRVAIKTLHPEYAHRSELVTRFHREAQAASRIGHVNIVEVLDFGTDDQGAPFLVMEHLEGRSLAGVLGHDGTFPVERSADVIGQTLGALDAAHAKGIIHRDLKPENIFLTDHGGRTDFVKLLDFGISKFQTAVGEPKLTTTGVTLGTPYYMAPEQAAGESNLDHRVDVYAMGAVLFETLAGRPPYEGTNYNQLLAQILSTDPPPLHEFRPDVPLELVRVVHKALARRRADRYATAGAMLEALLPFGATRTPFERTGTGKRKALEARGRAAHLPTVPAAPEAAAKADVEPAARPEAAAKADAEPAATPRRSRGVVPVEPVSIAPTAQLDLTPSSRIDLVPDATAAATAGRSRASWLVVALVLVAGLGVFAWWRMSARPGESAAPTAPATPAIPAPPAAGPAAATGGGPDGGGPAERAGQATPAVVPASSSVDSGALGPASSADAGPAIEADVPEDAGPAPLLDAVPPPVAPERDTARRVRDAGRTGRETASPVPPADAGRPDRGVMIGPRDARFLTTYEEDSP
ncbi:MAG: serine/threonine protein kinase [Deltaproteobacteria bacterium]|nr:serine/threonine protein kinase [Deltaproteobacteria bacterium]